MPHQIWLGDHIRTVRSWLMRHNATMLQHSSVKCSHIWWKLVSRSYDTAGTWTNDNLEQKAKQSTKLIDWVHKDLIFVYQSPISSRPSLLAGRAFKDDGNCAPSKMPCNVDCVYRCAATPSVWGPIALLKSSSDAKMQTGDQTFGVQGRAMPV